MLLFFIYYYNNTNEMCVERLLFCPLAVCLTLLLGLFFEMHGKGWFAQTCSFLGTITLELYLTHEKVLKLIIRSPIYRESDSVAHSLFTDVAAILIAILLSVILRRLFLTIERKTKMER